MKHSLVGLAQNMESYELWTARGDYFLQRAENCKRTNKKLSLQERGKALKCFQKARAANTKMLDILWPKGSSGMNNR
jgi:hypothetical protein